MLTLDLREFERKAKQLGGAVDQVPYALSRAMNDAAEATRTHLVQDTWPRHVKVRNPQFINASLTTRGKRATKTNLTVEIYDRLGRGNLGLHAKGGTRAGRGGKLAIPTTQVKATRGARGVPKRLRPRMLKRAVLKGNLLFQAQGRGKRAKLRLMYKLQSSAKIKKDVPFYEDFATMMRREITNRFPGAMQQAMATRR